VPGRLDPIDQVLALDLGRRGIADFFTPGAAVSAARALQHARRVVIATGFTVAADTPETDGPPGAAALGRALRLGGARVSYLTDPHNVPIVEAALKAHDEPVDVDVYPDGEGQARAWLARTRPTHLVAIERPGRAKSGDYLNLRGVPINDWNRRIDELFLVRSGAVTVGIGDGGNEIGMGNVRARLIRRRSPLVRVASVVRVDHLVGAGTSNWGAYGVAAALSRLTGLPLLHAPDVEPRVIDACVAAGAYDGVTRRRERTVDGLAAEVHAAIVHLLHLAARSE
jgi:hypothetical protein